MRDVRGEGLGARHQGRSRLHLKYLRGMATIKGATQYVLHVSTVSKSKYIASYLVGTQYDIPSRPPPRSSQVAAAMEGMQAQAGRRQAWDAERKELLAKLAATKGGR